MFVAVALSNQLLRSFLLVNVLCVPEASTRFRPLRKVRSAAVSRAWPFLLDQKPRVLAVVSCVQVPPVPPPPPPQAMAATALLLPLIEILAAALPALCTAMAR